jgi:hypothetical protein
MSYVLLKCGSSARGDANPRSDIDIVCIWRGTPPDYSELSSRYKEVVFYSQDTICRMKKKGSLFLTHLDIDSKYVEGDRRLMSLISSYRPNKSSLVENIEKTKKFIIGIGWYPSVPLGRLWLFDVLYVAIRNYVFCRNALSGIYKFGYLEALKSYGFDSEQIKIMLKVRDGKYSYRSSMSSCDIAVHDCELQKLCGWLLNAKSNFSRGGITDWSYNCGGGYWSERLVERAILNGEHEDDGFLEKMKTHNYSKGVLKKEVLRIFAIHKF